MPSDTGQYGIRMKSVMIIKVGEEEFKLALGISGSIGTQYVQAWDMNGLYRGIYYHNYELSPKWYDAKDGGWCVIPMPPEILKACQKMIANKAFL